MRQFLSASAIFSALLLAQIASADVFPIDVTITGSDPTGNPLQSDTVTGNITTDGTVGLLGPSNIVSWNLDLVDNLNSANNYDLTPADSTLVEDTGGLSASASGLSFNFSGTGEFLIQANDPGPFSGNRYFCFSTGGACLAGETIAPGDVFSDGVVLTGDSAPVGTQPLAPGSPSPVPEPSSQALVAAALVGLGALKWRRKLVR